jgi:hypothetical protein
MLSWPVRNVDTGVIVHELEFEVEFESDAGSRLCEVDGVDWVVLDVVVGVAVGVYVRRRIAAPPCIREARMRVWV